MTGKIVKKDAEISQTLNVQSISVLRVSKNFEGLITEKCYRQEERVCDVLSSPLCRGNPGATLDLLAR